VFGDLLIELVLLVPVAIDLALRRIPNFQVFAGLLERELLSILKSLAFIEWMGANPEVSSWQQSESRRASFVPFGRGMGEVILNRVSLLCFQSFLS
jgi:hypothetical protein